MKVLMILSAILFMDFHTEITLEELRKNYNSAVADSKKTDELYEKLKQKAESGAVWMAYKGATEGLLAKHAWNPANKVKYLNRAKETLIKAVEKDPQDVEVRFLRFSLYHNVPKMFSDEKLLAEDKQMMVRNLKNSPLPGYMKKTIADFLIASKRLTKEEEKRIEAL
jgi:hypothetical protein